MTRYDGLTSEELGRRVQAPRCLVFERVTSTLDVVHEQAAAGAPSGTLVVADEQVAGRGRQGRPWISHPGAGVWLGYLARPQHGGERGVAALRVGLATADALADLGITARLKWPNDLVVRDRKAGGVLCEARWADDRLRWMAIGVGINVRGPIPHGLEERAVALDEERPSVSRVAVLERLVPRLHRLPDRLELTEGELRQFHMHDWLADRRIDAPVRGRARGIDAEGALLVETDNGMERIVGGGIVAA
ncbi:MAG: biotin--[acetyl-CoA-carboxylase] ligase [Gemmatimonadales bacterium]|jgi:BirA family biotin operon repressor/biotin-[acetyl-CoA-carboxylase] ligase